MLPASLGFYWHHLAPLGMAIAPLPEAELLVGETRRTAVSWHEADPDDSSAEVNINTGFDCTQGGRNCQHEVHPLSIADGVICVGLGCAAGLHLANRTRLPNSGVGGCDQSVQCCNPQAVLDEADCVSRCAAMVVRIIQDANPSNQRTIGRCWHGLRQRTSEQTLRMQGWCPAVEFARRICLYNVSAFLNQGGGRGEVSTSSN